MAISGFPLLACLFIWSSPGQQGDYYEASEQRWLFWSRWIHRLFNSALGERRAFSTGLKSLNTEERAWDPFEVRATNKLCLAQMGEKGRADCHLSGTLKWQSINCYVAAANYCEKSVQIVYLFGENVWFPTEKPSPLLHPLLPKLVVWGLCVKSSPVNIGVEHGHVLSLVAKKHHGGTFIHMIVFYVHSVTNCPVKV